MKQPLLMLRGLIQASDDEKVQILRLNLGPSEPVLVTSDTVTLVRTVNHLIASGQRKVQTILGGEEGDIIILTGENVKLRTGGNISKRHNLQPYVALMLMYVDATWIPIG